MFSKIQHIDRCFILILVIKTLIKKIILFSKVQRESFSAYDVILLHNGICSELCEHKLWGRFLVKLFVPRSRKGYHAILFGGMF